MIPKLPPEKFWKLYKTLPEDLKEVLSSPKVGEDVTEICQRNGVPEKMEEILDCITLVLVGLLSPRDFQLILEKELKINSFVAKRISQEIFRFVFFPVKSSLQTLYGESDIFPGGIEIPTIKKSEKKPKEDIYREPVE